MEEGGKREGLWWTGRAEIDTSTPFESVNEAVDHFGGSGRWKKQSANRKGDQDTPALSENDRLTDEVLAIVEEQTGQLRKDLVVKERETLEIFKHLEITKSALDDLRLKVQKESSESDKKSQIEVRPSSSSSPPGLILMQLKQARLNLNRFDLAGIRSSVQMLKNELRKEKISMGKTCENIASNYSRISSLEKELNQTRLISRLVESEPGFRNGSPRSSPQISRKFHELRSETEQFRKMEACSKSEVSKMTEEIERTKARIKIIQIRIVAAQKLEEAAKANTQVVDTLSEIEEAQSKKLNQLIQNSTGTGVTLLLEDYNALVQRAHDAEEVSRKRIESAMTRVDEANKSKMEVLRKVEESNAELENSRKLLDEALHRVDNANKGKLSVEESLRKWRSEHGQTKRRSSVHNSPRFKNPYPSSSHHHRRSSKTSETTINGPAASRMSLLSIGQILSRKLADPEEDVESLNIDTNKEIITKASPKLSLAQMLNTRHESDSDLVTAHRKSLQAKEKNKMTMKKKKKTVGFVGRFPLILVNHYKKNRMNEK